MTALKEANPVCRETGTKYRGRSLVVELHERYLVIREKGRPSRRVGVDYEAAYELGWKLNARAAGEAV